ncbi:Conserved hypothetical protein [Candidatus Phytoplasma australiense]|uniref:Uncharacterized protein n=1 Tax=Phytoplasma australiense TaxID=59748 RepID=B1V9Q7_PHYAS|nr:Conserved hypothetical protein [Candidatus Phytoplasma australiense]
MTNNFNYVIIKVINKQFGFSENHIFFGKKCCSQMVPFLWSLPVQIKKRKKNNLKPSLI